MFSIKNYNIIVVGGSGGIGSEIVKGFKKAFANVTIFDISLSNASEVDFIKCDVSNNKSIKKAFKIYFKKNNSLDVIVNCAAITLPGQCINYKTEDWLKSIEVNLSGVFFVCKIAGEHMIENNIRGSIINITSIGAEQGFANNPGYAASKGGVKQLTKSLAVEWGSYGIRVNNLVPGYTNTSMNTKSWNDPDLKKQRANSTVIGRWAEPSEMIGPAIFLASKASSYMTGADLVIDGGWLIKGM